MSPPSIFTLIKQTKAKTVLRHIQLQSKFSQNLKTHLKALLSLCDYTAIKFKAHSKYFLSFWLSFLMLLLLNLSLKMSLLQPFHC